VRKNEVGEREKHVDTGEAIIKEKVHKILK